jgi:hypothetical protein
LKQTPFFHKTFGLAIRYIPDEKSGDVASIGAKTQQLFSK